MGPDLNLWVERIRDTVPDLRQVGGALDLAAARVDMRNTPAVYVIPVQDLPGTNAVDNAVIQSVTATVGIVIAVRNYQDVTGFAGHDALRTYRTSLRDALLGWQPSDADDATEYQRGRLLEYNDATLWWQDEYRTFYSVRAT